MLPVPDRGRAVDALHCIPADLPRNQWVRVLMAAHAAEISEAEAEPWSAQAASFNARDFRDTWRSIKPGGGIGPGTLFKIAAEHGYRMKAEKRQPLTLAHPRAEPARTAQEPRTPLRQGEGPCVVWNRCLEAPADHPYIVDKDGLPDGLKVVPAGDPLRIAGESMAGALVVPVQRPDGTISSLQFIAPPDVAARLKTAGKPGKLNLPGASLDGAWLVGTITPTLYLCEGIGQAWAVHKATGCGALVSFGWGRVRTVASELREVHPQSRLVLVPDVGKESEAETISREVRADVVRMPEGWPQNSDVNDYAKQEGHDALAMLLNGAVQPPQRYKLLSSDDLANLPPLQWRVRGVLPAVGLAALYGPSASGKSFLALDLAAATAEGSRWFGIRTEAAPVVYAALEGEAGFRLRVQAWEAHTGRKLPNGLRMMLQPFKLTEAEDLADLAAVVLPGAVVFLDTLNRAAPTADENSSRDMGEILEAAKVLQMKTGGLVVLVHHTGKDATKGLRGHSSLFAAMDAAVEVFRDGDRREWRVAKAKDGEDGDAYPFRLQVETLGTDEHGDAITSCVVVPDTAAKDVKRVKLPQGGNQRLVFDALRDLFKTGEMGKSGAPPMRPCIALEVAVGKAAGALTCEAHRRTTRARDAITGLVARGVLGLSEGWLWLAT